MRIKVRHNRNHAVLAVVQEEGGHVCLMEVREFQGPMPEVRHIVGAMFPDLQSVRRALVAAMKGIVGDTLDNILLSRAAYAAWNGAATAAAKRLAANGGGLDPEAIPDEMAKPLPDGRLLIWVDLPNGERVELAVPKSEWAWRSRPN